MVTDLKGYVVVQDGIGTATLSSGTVTVTNARVNSNTRILVTGQDNNVAGSVRAIPGSGSFTITSSNAGDSGVVFYICMYFTGDN